MSRIVCGTSVSETSSSLVPAGMPGPRMTKGTRDEGSYGRYLPPAIRCSPRKNPLSDVKTM
jgi:hypothetical protein